MAFEIKEAFSVSPTGDDLMVHDAERGAWLQRIGGMGNEPGDKFIFEWNDFRIGIHTIPYSIYDDEGNESVVSKIVLFSDPVQLNDPTGTTWRKAYPPWSKTKMQQARMLAVEALLRYGSNYNGHKRPDVARQVELDGKLYRKSDFGLH